MINEIELIPDDQQEDEDDIVKPVTFKDAVVLNADWTIETINIQIKKGNIDLQPGFQRRVAWDDTRKSRLLESIIVGMPVPNIVLAENKDHRGRFIVIDGKQRLVSISEFLDGSYKLKGGLSDILCKRGFVHSGGSRSSNWMVNRVSAAFQSRIGMVHFWLMFLSAR